VTAPVPTAPSTRRPLTNGSPAATSSPGRLAIDLTAVTSVRDGRTEQLADEVVAVARQLWQAAGTQRPASVPEAFAQLRPRHIQVLRLLAAQPGISVRVAAEALSMRAHNLSTLLTDLVGAGLVERRGDPRDRRIARLYLSEAAHAEVERIERGRLAAVVDALGRLTDVDQGRIRSALPALRRLLAGLAEPPGPS